MGNGITSLWGSALAEATVKTRQSLQVPCPSSLRDLTTGTAENTSISERSCCCSARAVLDPDTTRTLRDECLSRGVPLESIILASLFVAAAEAATVSGQTAAHVIADPAPAPASAPAAAAPAVAVAAGGTCHGKHDGGTISSSIRFQRGLILGLVAVVMALLSGSVDSKALRYFCSFYAVFAGAWAVNVITVAPPGFMFLMATSAATKVEKDGAADVSRGPTFTPVRLAVDSRRGGLWDTAERHRRGSRGMSLSEESFRRFKGWSRAVRGAWRCWSRWWQRRLERIMAGATAAAWSAPEEKREELPPPFQLFGCIRRGRGVVGAAPAPLSTPTEALETEGSSKAGASVVDCGGGGGGHDVAALLSVLDSRYTLMFRDFTTSGGATTSLGGSIKSSGGSLREETGESSRRDTNASGGGSGSGGGGGGCSSDGERISPAPGQHPEGLELRLVEDSGKRCCFRKNTGGDRGGDENGGSMTKWLLEHATAILVDALPCPYPP
ncbi:unnamed protein product [Pylaiella littoralis]